MRFYDDEYPELHALLNEREKHTKGPFDKL